MRTWKDDFTDAIKVYFDIPGDADISIEEDYQSDPCEMCGSHESREVHVYWYEKVGKKQIYRSKTYDGRLSDLIANLD